MILLINRAITDILNNKFLYIVSIFTITISIFIVSMFTLFFVNTNKIMDSWEKGIKIMAYLKSDKNIEENRKKILNLYGVKEIKFISKKNALNLLKKQMKRQSSLFTNIESNPLPDAFEIKMINFAKNHKKIDVLASQIESLPFIDDVEYGEKWIVKYINIFNLFKFTGYGICVVFFITSIFIVVNTIKLIFYSRKEELKIMRLVGATDNFIKNPFYISGVFQGFIGGILGILILFIIYLMVLTNVDKEFILDFINVRFLSFYEYIILILCSIFSGWFGCYIALKKI